MSDTTSRRSVLKLIALIPSAGSMTKSNRKRYGLLTVDGHRAHAAATGEHLHVYLDGVDVTRNCYEADDVAGYVLVYCRDEREHKRLDATGALHVTPDGGECGACRLHVRGDVVIAPGPKL